MIPQHISDRLHQLKDSAEKLVLQATTGSLSKSELEEYLTYIKAIKREYRVLRGEHDLLYFAYEYFSDRYNPENENNLIPGQYDMDSAPDFHGELCGILNTLNVSVKQKICWSVPRGHAKSAYLSNVFPVHQIVYKLRHYILIVSETEGMSRKFVEWVADQLKFNQKLREDFGILLHENKMANEQDNQEGFVTTTNTRVQSASIGKQLRGARHGAYRPDLVIMDDLESAKNTNTKELREKNLHWMNSVVMPIGDITRTAYIYMGTTVHSDGLLTSVLNRSDFRGKMYSAIISEPNNMELWEEFEKTLRDLDNPDRERDAETLYYANKEEMDDGARTLWNDRFPYFELMKIKVNVGSKAFGSEYLNNPIDSESAVFNESYLEYFDDKDLFYNDGTPMNLDIYGFWDIAIGKNSSSDYNAIITVGRDKRTGIIYVLDAWVKKVPLHKALEEVVRKIKATPYKIFGIETVAAQYEAYRQVQERMLKEGVYRTRIMPINPRTKKEERIMMLEPLFEQGAIRIKKSQRQLIDQLITFPGGTNDDAIDALAAVVDIAGKMKKRTFWKKPAGF